MDGMLMEGLGKLKMYQFDRGNVNIGKERGERDDGRMGYRVGLNM